MSRRKKPPEVSTITRPALVAFARKQKPGNADGEDADEDDDDTPPKDEKTAAPPERPTMPIDPATFGDRVQEAPPRARDTVGMAIPTGSFGAPPEIPEEAAAAIVIKGGAVEDPTHMPGPREIPPGNPDDVASPPGHVPRGDSRSLRRRADHYEFALIYRRTNAVISRFGVVGTRGVWRVVEYPTTSSASNAYAREASRFVTDGFSDYRE